jgi:glycosyltransferase involved in cell wall biosynthesis
MNSVAIFSDTIWPFGGGGELATYLYAKLLQREGINVVLVTNKPSNEAIKHFTVVELKRFGRGKYSVALNFNQLTRILQSVDVTYFASSMLEMFPLVKILFRKSTVVHIHSYYPYCPMGHLYNFSTGNICIGGRKKCARCIWMYERLRKDPFEAILSTALNSTIGKIFSWTLRFADALIFVSKFQRELFLNLATKIGINIDHSKTYVIYNPLPPVTPVRMEGDDIGFLGSLDPIKGFESLYKAWIKIFNKYPSRRLHAAMTHKLPKSFETKGIVRYGRLTPSHQILELIRKVRAIVVPSISPEPSPYVAVETCLYGRLLVASNIGGIPEIVGGLPGVRLVPYHSIDDLADALDWALSMNRDTAIELGLKNREIILRRYSSEYSARELIRVFESC